MKYVAVSAAFCLAALCSPVQAQQVTLYGLFDVGVEYVNHVPTGKNGPQASAIRLSNANLLGSRWGMQGTEDLGDGWKVFFALESGFTVTDGRLAQNGRMFGRKAYVGFDSPYGIFAVGRQRTLVYDYFSGDYDAALGSIYSIATYDTWFTARMDNSVRYTVSHAGFLGGAMYSTGYDATIADGAQVPGASKVGREYQLLVRYKREGSPLAAAVAWDQQQGTSIATQDNALQRLAVGLSYTIGKYTGVAGYRWLNGQNGASAVSSNMYWAGLTYHISAPFYVSLSGYHMQMKNTRNGPSSGVLLVDYFISKTTDFYGLFSKAWNPASTNLGVDGNGLTGFGVSQTGGIIGIRHTF